jgi:hypothetical protein
MDLRKLMNGQSNSLSIIPANAGIHAVEMGTGFRRCDGI